MKFILIMLLVIACGRNEMPVEQDLGDSDGDQIPNALEKAKMSKYFADIIPLQEINLELEFPRSETDHLKQTRSFSNKIDLQKYSKDLLVRNLLTIKSSQYFSEFSYMRINDTKASIPTSGEMISVTVRTSNTQNVLKTLLYVSNDQRAELAVWTPLMKIKLTSAQLNAVLSGEAHLVASHLDKTQTFYSPEESIKEKTYRVLVNDGVSTNIYYISKDLPFAEMLKYFNIVTYKNIEEQNLLGTIYRSENAEWWVRKINNRDIVLAKVDLRSLANHYLEGFQKTNLVLERKNGKVKSAQGFKKHPVAKVLLKIRGEQNTVHFSEERKRKDHYVIRGGKPHRVTCFYYVREASSVSTHTMDEFFLMKVLGLQAKSEDANMVKAGDDEKGRFLEIQMSSNDEIVSFSLDALPNDQYGHEGVTRNECEEAPGTIIQQNLQVPERSLILNIEAFVEKI